MKKRLILLVLLLVLLPSFAAAGMDRYAVVNNPNPADRLNLRAQPDVNAESLGKYLNGTVVQVLSEQNGWASVRVGSTEGYMMTAYLSASSLPVTPMFVQMMVSNPYANVQGLLSTCGTDMQQMAMLSNGTLVMLFGYAGEYGHVQYGGITGYVPMDCLVEWMTAMRQASPMPVPEPLTGTLVRAVLQTETEERVLTDPQALEALSALLVSRDHWGQSKAGCIFGANLLLEFADGSLQIIELATDGCCIYRQNGHDFRYAFDQGDAADSGLLFGLFDGLTVG